MRKGRLSLKNLRFGLTGSARFNGFRIFFGSGGSGKPAGRVVNKIESFSRGQVS